MDESIQVGRYQVEKVIGRGAMGVVYLAYDPQIDRRVALKTIRPLEGARDEEIAETRERFLREAKAAGRLLHPNIVTIFDVFEDRGILYIAMEYVEGELLDAYCSKKSLLPMEQVLRLVTQGLSALHYAHRHGVVHRDIKPANLMMVEDGNTLKIMDFGVARQAGAHLTQTGMVVGTPHYMSPEQIEGEVLDGRSDVFSMGVVLYELLTGERPFPGDSISTVIYRIIHDVPLPVHKVNGKIPEALAAILQKALAKDRESRYSSALEFQQALEGFLASRPMRHREAGPAYEEPRPGDAPDSFLPPPPSTGVRRRRKKGRIPGRALLLAGLAALLAAAVFIGLDYYWSDQGGTKIPIIRPPASQEKLPVLINVVTDPPGADLFLDGSPVKVVTIPPGDHGLHLVEARLGCLSAKKSISNVRGPETIKLALQPGYYTFRAETDPSGAEVFVDGRDTGKSTPLKLDRDGCEPFTLAFVRKGWIRKEVRVNPRESTSLKVTLEKEPDKGTLRAVSASGTIKIYEDNRLLGRSGQSIELPAGEHTLRFVDETLRGTREQQVTIKPDATNTLNVPAFKTARVFLYGKPADEGKVIVDGTYLEDLPLNGTTPLAVGFHRFTVVGSDGKRVSFKWTLGPGDQTRVVDFDTGKVSVP